MVVPPDGIGETWAQTLSAAAFLPGREAIFSGVRLPSVTLAYDLHTHTLYSDGTLTPAELVARAHANGVTTLALTDHDATDGLPDARMAAQGVGMRLVSGVEISVTWRRLTVHVVGLYIDPAEPRLQQGLARLRELRLWRAQEIGRRLSRKNIDHAYEHARALARGAVVARTHFARFLVTQGLVANMGQAFRQYLGPGRVAHVPGQWAGLEEAVGWIRAAGGVAVIAHPARYRLSGGQLKRLLAEFRECGGRAVEVVCGSHGPVDVERVERLALELNLLGSCGSDYHGPEKPWVDLGKLAPLGTRLTPVWNAFGERERPARMRGSAD